MRTSVLLSQKYRSTQVHKFPLIFAPSRQIHRSTEYPYKVPAWELQYFCHRSTEVHIQCSYMRTSVLLQQKYTSTQVPSKVTLGGTLEQPTPCTSVPYQTLSTVTCKGQAPLCLYCKPMVQDALIRRQKAFFRPHNT